MSGRIDIHSHMIPGIDDGCEDIEQSLTSIEVLQSIGYVGTICTPHVWPELFPSNTTTHIKALTANLSRQLQSHGIDYRLWSGGELRLFKGAEAWLKEHGVPTLGESRYVLCDLWGDRWPKFADQVLKWLLDEKYIPVLAHPERIDMDEEIHQQMDRLTEMGVLFQGNFRCFTGLEGFKANLRVREFLQANRYHVMAMDMHRPEALESRVDGMRLFAQEFGENLLDQMTISAPCQLLGLT